MKTFVVGWMPLYGSELLLEIRDGLDILPVAREAFVDMMYGPETASHLIVRAHAMSIDELRDKAAAVNCPFNIIEVPTK